MNKKNSKIDSKTIILFILTLTWMGLIYWFSSQPAAQSADLSGSLVYKLHETIKMVFGEKSGCILDLLLPNDHFIRKAGHVFEYMILGFLVTCLIKRFNVKAQYLISIILCLSFAISDEVHQMFVPGRGPLVGDIFLDTLSAGIAVLIVYNRSSE